MDTWVWGFYHTPGVTMPTSVTPNVIPFDYAAWTNINGSNLHKLIDLGDDMPDSLQNLIVKALREVYLPKSHPNVKGTIPFLEKEHINRAYQMLVEGLELMTSKDRFLPPPQRPSVSNDEAFPSLPTPGGGSGSTSGGSSGGSFSLSALLESILDFVKDLFEYIHDVLLWLISQGTFPLTYAIRYALYQLQLALYEIYRQYRFALCLSGYAFPDPDQLFNPLAQELINPKVEVPRAMPRREFPEEQDHCLFFPSGCADPQTPSCIEPQACSSGPYVRFPLNYPFWFIEGEPTDPEVEKALSAAKSPAETIEITNRVFFRPRGGQYNGSLGSAVDFFVRRAGEVAQDQGGANALRLPDWNLDGDRGYGFLCWKVVPDGDGNPTALEPPPEHGVVVTYECDPDQP